jgi:type IV secretory pathway protease TraF
MPLTNNYPEVGVVSFFTGLLRAGIPMLKSVQCWAPVQGFSIISNLVVQRNVNAASLAPKDTQMRHQLLIEIDQRDAIMSGFDEHGRIVVDVTPSQLTQDQRGVLASLEMVEHNGQTLPLLKRISGMRPITQVTDIPALLDAYGTAYMEDSNKRLARAIQKRRQKLSQESTEE